MSKQLLIFAWEFYGYHSIQGTALSRRVKQVADGFRDNGWEVTVIHKDHREESAGNEYKISKEPNGVKRIAVKDTTGNTGNLLRQPVLKRRLQTIYYTLFRGDRSYQLAKKVIKHFNELDIEAPDLIIGFFTPRGPLYLGNYFSKKLNAKWIADLQDTFNEGINPALEGACITWTRKILRGAHAIVHVSPEWAKRDGDMLRLEINTIRHTVASKLLDSNETVHKHSGNEFKVFYGGSLIVRNQSLSLLKKVINSMEPMQIPFRLFICGTEQTFTAFKKELGNKIEIINLGWLDRESYLQAIMQCDCTLVIPWSTPGRMVIPSKFYDLCGIDKPIWIIGEDTGSFHILLNEWQHPSLPVNDFEFQKKALHAAMQKDYNYLFDIKKCKGKIIKEADLYDEYIKLL